jgi:hypothetical protein
MPVKFSRLPDRILLLEKAPAALFIVASLVK